MSANSATNLKSRLRVVPIDEWSTREKLCLASGVLKSGDQNWSSVSRPLKAFAEPNRPNDWFHQKYCAIQYHDLLEKIETDTPKRKRSERGEETPQTIIVRNLTKQRIEELKRITQTERELIAKIKRDLDSLKNNKMSEKRLQDIYNEIKQKEVKEKEREIEYKKWLEEREQKIAQMSRKGTLHPRKPIIPLTPSTPVTPSVNQQTSTPSVEGEAKSPINEPLKVEVDSEANTTPTPQTPNPVTGSKLSQALTSPSTSPLLTSLLQSPTPSTPNIISPNKSGISVNSVVRQKPFSPISTSTQISRRPSIHSSPQKIADEKPMDTNDSLSTSSNTAITEADNSAQQKTTVESSKLSKLLESPTKQKNTNTNEVKSPELKSQVSENKEVSEQSVETQQNSSQSSVEEIQTIDSQTKDNSTKKSEESIKNNELSERLVRNTEKPNDSTTETEELKDNNKETDKTITDKKSDEMVETISIKQEVIETIADDDKQQKEIERTGIKEEPMDSNSTTTEEDSNQRTPSNRPVKRNRKPVNSHPITITPTAMRRSRRVALKDSKSTNDESTEVSDQSAANTPQAVKKRGSVDDTTETSMSEESMDARIVAPTASIETVPNSPASVRTEDMDNSKEYRTWKKAIMVNWRLISAHKNASLFSHPVTEAEAKGYEDIVQVPMDLNTIKKRVETGVIRTTSEYQRDILLMFQNAIMFNNADHDVHKMAVDMQKDTIDMIEEFIETRKHDNQNNESKLRARDRRSNVSTPLAPNDNEISGRRKSRGASTDTDSNASGLTKSLIKKKKN